MTTVDRYCSLVSTRRLHMNKLIISLLLLLTALGCGKGSKGDAGAPGAIGAQGLPGQDGAVGPKGDDGTSTFPDIVIKLCSDDTSGYPEYGIKIYNPSLGAYQLFAVYWGPTPVSGTTSQAFLALITAGSYRSTGGNGCAFSVDAFGNVN